MAGNAHGRPRSERELAFERKPMVRFARVPRKWALRPEAAADSPRLEPVVATIRPRLLEAPIVVPAEELAADG